MEKRVMLEDQIEKHLSKMKTFDPGSQEMTQAIKELDTMYSLAEAADTNSRKARAEDEAVVYDERKFAFEYEKFQNEKKQAAIKNCIEASGLLLGNGLTLWAIIKGFKFEQTGTFCSTTLKNVLSKLKFK